MFLNGENVWSMFGKDCDQTKSNLTRLPDFSDKGGHYRERCEVDRNLVDTRNDAHHFHHCYLVVSCAQHPEILNIINKWNCPTTSKKTEYLGNSIPQYITCRNRMRFVLISESARKRWTIWTLGFVSKRFRWFDSNSEAMFRINMVSYSQAAYVPIIM